MKTKCPYDILIHQKIWEQAYGVAKIDILSIIESRISEIIGDAQPKPALRAELQELIKRIKEEMK
jgi:hypothetical protein